MSDSPAEPLATKPRWESLRRKSLDGAPPAFSVRYLILVVTMTALHLAVVRFLTQARPFGGEASPSAIGFLVVQSTLVGVAYTGLLALWARLLGRTAWRIEPGHWILAAIGFAAGGQTLAELLNYLAPQPVLAAGAIHLTLLGVALIPLLLSRASSRLWKCCGAALLGLTWAQFLWDALPGVGWSMFLSLGSLAVLLSAVWLDQERADRGWFHWAGVIVWLCSRCLPPWVIWLFG